MRFTRVSTNKKEAALLTKVETTSPLHSCLKTDIQKYYIICAEVFQVVMTKIK